MSARGPETMREPARPSARPWTVLAGDALPLPRRFNHAVRWEVDADDGRHVIAIARSALKARRTARRTYPWIEFGEARLVEPIRIRPRERLSKLIPGMEYQATIGGATWQISPFADGAISIGQDGKRGGALLPAYVARELRLVHEAVEVAIAVPDFATVLGRIAHVITFGVVLSAPVRLPRAGETHATVGRHPDCQPDGERDAFACVTDPGGVVVQATHRLGRTWSGDILEPDRGPFGAAKEFVERVGEAGAMWSVEQAKARDEA